MFMMAIMTFSSASFPLYFHFGSWKKWETRMRDLSHVSTKSAVISLDDSMSGSVKAKHNYRWFLAT